MTKRKKTSSKDHTHPYLKLSFWIKPENQFWNNAGYSQASKEYFNDWIQRLMKAEKYLPNIEQI